MTRGRPKVPRRHRDEGETLIEILLSVAISGIVIVGLVAGLTTAILASDTHRHLSDVEVVARQYGEALVSQAYHPATAQVSALSGTGLGIKNLQGSFPAAPFFVAIDGEVLKVTSASGSSWTLAAAALESHLVGALITYDVMHDACLSPTHLQPAAFTVPGGAKNIQAPSISAPVEFFDAGGSLLPAGGCENYWKTVLPCSAYAPLEHLTACDPALLRVTLNVSTGAGSPSRADTTSRVLIRRGDA